MPPPRILTDKEAAQADYDALNKDWKAVGDDLKTVMERFPLPEDKTRGK